jgi:NADPH:quinone reductase-like Zn-dependent oxidoreductase/acyl carrier protein
MAGLARVLANERPEVETRHVEIRHGGPREELGTRVAALLADPPEEPELLLEAARQAAPRLMPLDDAEIAPAPGGSPGDCALSLSIARRGSFDSLAWSRATRRAPGPGELEIAVCATGLNFRDVMWAQGLLPEEALEDGFTGPGLGMECAGEVVRAGDGVEVAPGARVMALAPLAFSSHVTLPAGLAAPVPAGMPIEAAAALPVAFLTAEHALSELSRLRRGESVLIHGAAGGVGLAALQVARRVGARVLATAGSADKRALLAALGADAVFDSRSLDFAEGVEEATEGRGVDVVLNSLSGEAMRRSIGCLAPFGRFVELGKRDIYEDSRIGLRPFRANLSYFAVDADQLLRHRPGRAADCMRALAERIRSGDFRPLPVRAFDPQDAAAAMRLMAGGGHVGKIVIRPPLPAPVAAGRPRLGSGAWLVTGGTRGFGLATARRLAESGVRRLYLVGRSGRVPEGEAARLEAIRAAGARAEIIAADVSDEGAMRSLLSRIASEGALEGVVHAATAMDDARLAALDAGRIARVLRPKLDGATLLDRLTRRLAPRHFVLYSSLSACIGTPGQAAYAAANAALEGLAERRRAEGLPALCIGWGPISDVGYLARETGLRDGLAEVMAGGMMTSEEALDALCGFLAREDLPPVLRHGRVPWGRLAGVLPLLRGPITARLEIARRDADVPGGLARHLLSLPEDRALRVAREVVVEEVAAALRQDPGTIEADRPLADLGLDSLLAVDVKLAIEYRLGRPVPSLALGERVTAADLAGRLLLALGSGEPPTGAGDPDLAELVARHLDPEGGEVDPLLLDRLSRSGPPALRGVA